MLGFRQFAYGLSVSNNVIFLEVLVAVSSFESKGRSIRKFVIYEFDPKSR